MNGAYKHASRRSIVQPLPGSGRCVLSIPGGRRTRAAAHRVGRVGAVPSLCRRGGASVAHPRHSLYVAPWALISRRITGMTFKPSGRARAGGSGNEIRESACLRPPAKPFPTRSSALTLRRAGRRRPGPSCGRSWEANPGWCTPRRRRVSGARPRSGRWAG